MRTTDSPSSETEPRFVCASEPWLETECVGEKFHGVHNEKQYCIFHFPGKKSGFWGAVEDKLKRHDFNFQGVWFPSSYDFKDKKFSDEVNFERAHFEGEVDFSGALFERDANFSHCSFRGGAYFHDVTFKSVSFEGSEFKSIAQFSFSNFRGISTFRSCKFDGSGGFAKTTFEGKADFSGVIFRQTLVKYPDFEFDCVDFSEANFYKRVEFGAARFENIARFRGAIFADVVDLSNGVYGGRSDFTFCRFNSVSFLNSTFDQAADFHDTTFFQFVQFRAATFNGDLDFSDSTFGGLADFEKATFRRHVRFSGGEDNVVFNPASCNLDLQLARFEKPQNVAFHSVTLHPHWFINVDARSFDFVNVHWQNYGDASEELELLQRKGVGSRHTLLAVACRRLALNCEENARFRNASQFRRMAMDAERLETWRGFDVRSLTWWYWIASGYGERPSQALLVLIGIFVLFSLLYTQVAFARWEPRLSTEADVALAQKDVVGAPLKFRQALTYSAGVMTLQRPEPKPATTTAQTIVLLETILGPVQAALLALAIRRKFMR